MYSFSLRAKKEVSDDKIEFRTAVGEYSCFVYVYVCLIDLKSLDSMLVIWHITVD